MIACATIRDCPNWIRTVNGDVQWFRPGEDSGPLVAGARLGPESHVLSILRDSFAHRWDTRVGVSALAPGQFYPRIQRLGRDPHLGPDKYVPMAQMYPDACRSSLSALRALFSRLEPIFRVVEPEEKNFAVYGHELRHLLILACTEIESGLKAVLELHGAKPSRGKHFCIEDYRRLVGPMRLKEWNVHLIDHDWFISPFQEWEKDESPSWWKAYNAVKHNREAKLEEASLLHTLGALGGACVVVAAQFGPEALTSRGGFQMPGAMAISGTAIWSPGDFYVPPVVGGEMNWNPTLLEL